MKVCGGVGGEGAVTFAGFKSLGSDKLNCWGPRESAVGMAGAVRGNFRKSRAVGEGGDMLEIRNGQYCSEFL